jgi:hypothetical protein
MAIAHLDAVGRCCGRKPMVYKRPGTAEVCPFRFCPRCDRAFDMEGQQVANWAFVRVDGEFEPNVRYARKI